MQIEERKRLHAKLMQKVRDRQLQPSEAADEMQAEVGCPAMCLTMMLKLPEELCWSDLRFQYVAMHALHSEGDQRGAGA